MNQQLDSRFLAARKKYIAAQFSQLNSMQQEAVLTTEGPLLLLAGAGSGKTTVLINRIANLMRFGRGSDSNEIPDTITDEDVAFLESLGSDLNEYDRWRADNLCAVEPAVPWSIIAITFTNKAANELKERLSTLLGQGAEDIWAMTFHSACCRILRRDIERMGYSRSFTIYDSSDSERIMKDIIKDMGLDDKTFPAKYVLGAISKEKDKMVSPQEMLERAENSNDLRALHIARAYVKYQTRLKDNNALDFDDIIYVTVKLLLENEDVKQYYQRKFKYVLVDEYQDTNHMQYLLTSLLAGGYENICVVGDDDQSIYRFRGATIENILSFEDQYKGCRTIRLEQNYRSTKNILEAANAVIRHNQGRKGKELWTRAGEGEKLTLHAAMNEHEEAQYVAARILEGYSQGRRWKDHAILYRMNAQSNQMENACKRNGIPYRIIGGTRFFDRAEVKDMIAYLAVLNHPEDDLRLTRIINNPPRGIGARTVEVAQQVAQREGTSLYAVIDNARLYPELERSAPKLAAFTSLMGELAALLKDLPLDQFYEELLVRTGYAVMLEGKNTVEDRTRLENVRELLTSIRGYLDNAGEEPSLAGFLDEIALYTDLDSHDPDQDCVVMMTMHAAKGLEFPVVFVAGTEEGIFPGIRAIGETEEMEEERRLCYVAMTRAKEKLYLTCANQRMLFGRTSSNRPSRFVQEIPEEHMERSGRARQQEREDSWGGGIPSRSSGYTGYGSYGTQTQRTAKPPQATYGGFTQAMAGRPAPAKPAAPAAFQKGDMVNHKAFGQGVILSVQKMGGDALVEIAFDDAGTKRLMLKSAAAHMTKK